MKTAEDLRRLLQRIDRKSYPAYKDTRGSYQFDGYSLMIDHVQGDPFASPSKVSIAVPGAKAAFPTEFYNVYHKRIALQDHLVRLFGNQLNNAGRGPKGSGKSGQLFISRCGQEILERTACEINSDSGIVLVRFEIGFPAFGRTINAQELIHILFDLLPECVRKALFYRNIDQKKAEAVIRLAEDQHYIREQLIAMELTAFVADGAILPRESGVSSRPMKGAVPFNSPESYRVTMTLPNKGIITGMGIPKGITLIVGGGYHGKSTLLKALELGVYNHIAGDGREYVITDPTAVKIRAEDGRSIKKTDISMFISNLPNKKDTVAFYTEDASGSTSQAANVVEAMESGTGLFLIDEDTSATNFMIRDELMQRVVHRDQEPITPFIERVRSIYLNADISTIIVAGSSGSYFHIADHIIQMDQYCPKDITRMAKKEAQSFPEPQYSESHLPVLNCDRRPKANEGLKRDNRVKMKTSGKDTVSINRENIDLRYVEQLIDFEQLQSLGYILIYAEKNLFNGQLTIQEIVGHLRKQLEKQGLKAVSKGNSVPVNMSMPRPQEIYACLNRYRMLNV